MFLDTREQIVVITSEIAHAEGDFANQGRYINCFTTLCTRDDFANNKRRVEGIAFRALRNLLHDIRALIIMSTRG